MLRTLQDQIIQLKKEQDIAILAHSYQSPDILEIADCKGDSYALSVAAEKLSQQTVVMCGVRFMAETVKILSPEKKVILPVTDATCPMAEQITPERVLQFKEEHPDYQVVAYVNTTAQLKAVCDVCVTSSSALNIVKNMEAKNILFIPDKNLGSYVKANVPDKNIVLWDGCCPVHNSVTEAECLAAKQAYPNAKLLMHPELPADVLQYADVVGSTADILKYARQSDEDCIIGTEKSIADTLKLEKPGCHYHLLSKKLMCPDMRVTTLADILKAMKGEGGDVIELDETIRKNAKRAIDEMIRLGQ
ncbi:quinolinate synthase NadA [Massiliimalia timonensis]|uniref:quinolinate synthase NadA n=1 Tax=Massiliimalia timonensis TaxID=1987501 RepID=UPI000B8AAF4D|nr:quinolinate synthase NadA [Massiliimalia timonensis]MBS7175070.1 quinolinate synthase NadA [Clostridiales bacterium]